MIGTVTNLIGAECFIYSLAIPNTDHNKTHLSLLLIIHNPSFHMHLLTVCVYKQPVFTLIYNICYVLSGEWIAGPQGG